MGQKSGITYTDFFRDPRSQGEQKAWLRHWTLRAHRKCAGVPHAAERMATESKKRVISEGGSNGVALIDNDAKLK